jgi:hypothetical protein
MGFAMYGHPPLEGELNEIQIRVGLHLHASSWLNGLNYDNYKENVFQLDLKIYSQGKSKFEYNSDKEILNQLTEKNNLIIWELKTIEGLIQWIEKVFEFYDFSKFEIHEYKKQYESEIDVSDFWELKNNYKNSVMQQQKLLNEIFISSDVNFLLYISCVLFNDLSLVYDFLKEQYKVGLPVETPKKTKKTLSFNEFFIEGIPDKVIEAIKNKYSRELTPSDGKEIAILTYLLVEDGIIHSLGEKQKSIKHFIEALFSKELSNVNNVGNYYRTRTHELNGVYEAHPEYKKIKGELAKICFNY